MRLLKVKDSKELEQNTIKKLCPFSQNTESHPKNGLVCLAGFMRIISPEFVKKYKNRIINIHPALLPCISRIKLTKTGIRIWCKIFRMFSSFCRFRNGYRSSDYSSSSKINEKDTEKSLSKRILKEEHRIYPEAVNLFARKKIKVLGRKTVIN